MQVLPAIQPNGKPGEHGVGGGSGVGSETINWFNRVPNSTLEMSSKFGMSGNGIFQETVSVALRSLRRGAVILPTLRCSNTGIESAYYKKDLWWCMP